MTTQAQRKCRNAGCRRSPPRRPLLDRLVRLDLSSPINGRRAMQASAGPERKPTPSAVKKYGQLRAWACLMNWKRQPKKKVASD